MPLCGRSQDRTRARSPRQLPTDHDYAARPANIRLINRRESFLDRYPRCLPPRQKEKPALVVDRSFHIRGGGLLASPARVTPARTWAICATVTRSVILCVSSVSQIPTMSTEPFEISSDFASILGCFVRA